MKFCNLKVQVLVPVAPFTGAWIEITPFWVIRTPQPVAPFTGAWIEMVDQTAPLAGNRVAPFTGAWIEIALRAWSITTAVQVATFTGAWIEIASIVTAVADVLGRSLHGSVD